MAFHPFQIVRKHQKGLLVVATIFCMVVFILQFGSGDVFSRFGLGHGGQGKADKVVTLYGKDLARPDIKAIQDSRQLGNDLIESALVKAESDAVKDVVYFKPDVNNPADQEIDALVTGCLKRQSELDNDKKLLSSNDPEEQQKGSQGLQIFPFIYFDQIQKDYATLLDIQRIVAGMEKGNPPRRKRRTRCC